VEHHFQRQPRGKILEKKEGRWSQKGKNEDEERKKRGSKMKKKKR